MKNLAKKIIIGILTFEARLALKKYKPKIVAITGTVGKTSTKDMIYAVLANSFYVRKSQKSFNGDIGVPLTVLGCNNAWNSPILWIKNIFFGLRVIFFPNHYPKWLVLEVGADRPNEIKNIAKWVRPDISVVTKLSKVPVHVEAFRSVADVIQEKSYLVLAVKKDGLLVLNGDDEDVRSMRELRHDTKAVFYGLEESSDFSASHYSIRYEEESEGVKVPIGISFKVNYEDNSIPVNIDGVLGKQLMYIALSAFTVGVKVGIPPLLAGQSINKAELSAGRMRLIKGIKDSIIIDDTYNSSPVALEESLNTLKEIETLSGRKIAVLGDMMELGMHSPEAHKNIGKVISNHADILITVGIRAREIAEVALMNGMDENNVFQFDDSTKAGKHLELLLQRGDIALIKGSQSIRMERAVKEVMANPEKAKELLARQDEEWLKR